MIVSYTFSMPLPDLSEDICRLLLLDECLALSTDSCNFLTINLLYSYRIVAWSDIYDDS